MTFYNFGAVRLQGVHIYDFCPYVEAFSLHSARHLGRIKFDPELRRIAPKPLNWDLRFKLVPQFSGTCRHLVLISLDAGIPRYPDIFVPSGPHKYDPPFGRQGLRYGLRRTDNSKFPNLILFKLVEAVGLQSDSTKGPSRGSCIDIDGIYFPASLFFASSEVSV